MSPSAVVPEGRDASASRPSGRAGHGSAPVVVGAIPAADDALAWALSHARRHGAPVRLVRAYEPGDLWPGGVACALGVPRAGLRDVLTRATLTRARRLTWPGEADPAVEVVEGRPVDALLAAARDAAMVVVGHRPRPAETVWGFGSVALGVLRRAHTAVTVVRSAADDGPVVVGIDGSSGAWRALRHALGEGAVRDVPTVAVVAGTAVVPEWAHRQVDEAARSLAEAGLAAGPAEVVADAGSPARALLEAGARQRAALLVVGHRGRGRTAAVMLGSVGQELVSRAPLPVTVVCPPPGRRPPT